MASGTFPALDAVLKAQAATNSDTIALIDAPDCTRFTGEAPRRLTWLQADRAAGAIAARLREIGLPPGTVVGLQMPNTAAGILTLLGVMRAGMIAAPMPLLWRRKDCVAALSAAGARALVTCGTFAGFDHATLALDVAAELFPIRAVCGFGCGSVDGIVPFDDLLSGADGHPDQLLFHDDAGVPFPLVTFDMTADGIVPFARDTAQQIAGGRLIRQRGEIGPRAVILSTLPMSSYAAISAALVPWLLGGGTLALHLPFDPDVLRQQISGERCDTLVVPDTILPAIGESGLLDGEGVRTVIAVWRAPERFAGAVQWTNLDIALVDVLAFGETALLAARRPPAGRSQPWPLGPLAIAKGGTECAHITQMPNGTLGIRGPLAAQPFRPYDVETDPDAAPGGGHVSTGHPCRAALDEDELIVTAAPAGLIAVGGYRFALHEMQQLVRSLDAGGVLAALPHALTGHRLAGNASDSVTMRDTLQGMRLNPLLTAAFRDRAA